MTYVIREMKQEDIHAVQSVAKIAWHDTYEGIIPREIQDSFLDEAYSDEKMKYRLENVRLQNEAELGAIYLLPDQQGKGIGSALLQKGLTILKGIRKLYIHVEAANEKGKRFYEAKGFAQLEEFEEDFEGHMMQTVRMVLYI